MCSHKLNAVLHCLINFNASLFLAFAVALCRNVANGSERHSLELVENSHAVVLNFYASLKPVVALRCAQVPL